MSKSAGHGNTLVMVASILKRFPLFLIFLGALCGVVAEACTCLEADLFYHYHEHSDVMQVRILRRAMFSDMFIYLAVVLKVYKGSTKPHDFVVLKTPKSTAACGIRLRDRRQTLVTVKPDGRPGTFLLSSCGYNREWMMVPKDERNWLEERYFCTKDGCFCADGTDPYACFENPCNNFECGEGRCKPNFCRGCSAEFFNDRGQPVCNACKGKQDCAMNQVCVKGECRTMCDDDGDCGKKSCDRRNGICVTPPPPGRVCFDGQKPIPNVVCGIGGEKCPYGYFCDGGVCCRQCPNEQNPITGYFCGRGPNRQDCPKDSTCSIHPTDLFAVCCPTKPSPDLCPDGQEALPEIFCGRGLNRQDCPRGYSCNIDPTDRFAVCCPIEPTDTCSLPADPGPCEALISSYYYDSVTRSCKPFNYGGCEGNENRFESLELCQKTCDICSLPKEPGPCKKRDPNFYFDSNTERCESFNYGGCRGNENRFKTLELCREACVCSLPMDVGPCDGIFEKYYFNTDTKSCELFKWGGCDGNANKFDTMEECEKSCKYL